MPQMQCSTAPTEMSVIYTKGAFLVREETLSDRSKVYDVLIHVDGYATAMIVYLAVSRDDALTRCDALHAAVS